MKLIIAPDPVVDNADLFLAGGISNCPDWQTEMAHNLSDLDITVFNPRREIYTDEDSAAKQIAWEHDALQKVTTILFWFPEETLCPITLFELGVFTQRENVDLFVGTHPNYARKFDVVHQLRLARPEVTVVESLDALTTQVIKKFTPEHA